MHAALPFALALLAALSGPAGAQPGLEAAAAQAVCQRLLSHLRNGAQYETRQTCTAPRAFQETAAPWPGALPARAARIAYFGPALRCPDAASQGPARAP